MVLAGPGPGLAGEHPGEVEAHDLAAGLGDVVVGGHARRSCSTDEAGASADGRARDRLVDVVRTSMGDVRPGSSRGSRRRASASPRAAAAVVEQRRLAFGGEFGVLVGVVGPALRRRGRRPSSRRPAPRQAPASSLLPVADLRAAPVGAEGRREPHESRLVALRQLGLELDEPPDDPLARRRHRPRRGSARRAWTRRAAVACAAAAGP